MRRRSRPRSLSVRTPPQTIKYIMDTETSLIIALAFALGWWLGTRFQSLWLHTSFRAILKDLGITEQQMRDLAQKNSIDLPHTELPVVEIRLEKMGDTIYAYRKDTEEFLGQGTDREALILRLTERLSNVRVVIAREDGADLLKS